MLSSIFSISLPHSPRVGGLKTLLRGRSRKFEDLTVSSEQVIILAVSSNGSKERRMPGVTTRACFVARTLSEGLRTGQVMVQREPFSCDARSFRRNRFVQIYFERQLLHLPCPKRRNEPRQSERPGLQKLTQLIYRSWR